MKQIKLEKKKKFEKNLKKKKINLKIIIHQHGRFISIQKFYCFLFLNDEKKK